MACVVRGVYVFALPGSPSACRDGWDELLVHQLDVRHRPCNFVEIMPRLMEDTNAADASAGDTGRAEDDALGGGHGEAYYPGHRA